MHAKQWIFNIEKWVFWTLSRRYTGKVNLKDFTEIKFFFQNFYIFIVIQSELIKNPIFQYSNHCHSRVHSFSYHICRRLFISSGGRKFLAKNNEKIHYFFKEMRGFTEIFRLFKVFKNLRYTTKVFFKKNFKEKFKVFRKKTLPVYPRLKST